MKSIFLSIALAAMAAAPALAATDAKPPSGQPIGMVVPLYGRTMHFQMPAGFIPAYKAEAEGQFIYEFTPKNETLENWTTLVTIRAIRGLGTSTFDDATLAEGLFNPNGCMQQSIYRPIGSADLGHGLSTLFLSTGCGSLRSDAYKLAKAGAGEQDFIQFFRDRENVYSIALAVRGRSFSASKPPITDQQGRERLKAAFGDVRVCALGSPDDACDLAAIAKEFGIDAR